MTDSEGNFYKYTNKGILYNFDLDQLTLDELRKFEKMTEKQRLRFIASFELNQNAPMTNEISLKAYYSQDNNEKYGDYALWDAKLKELAKLQGMDILTDEKGNILDSVLAKINYITPDDIIKAAKAFDSNQCNVAFLKKYISKKIEDIGLFETADLTKLKQLYSRLGVNRNQINQFNKLISSFTSSLKETNTNFTEIIQKALDTFIKALETKLKNDVPDEYKDYIELANISKNHDNIKDCLELAKDIYKEQGDTKNVDLCEDLEKTLNAMLNTKLKISDKPANTKPEREDLNELDGIPESLPTATLEEKIEVEDSKGPKVEEVKEDLNESDENEIKNSKAFNHILAKPNFKIPSRTNVVYGPKTVKFLNDNIIYFKMIDKLASYNGKKLKDAYDDLKDEFEPDFTISKFKDGFDLTPKDNLQKLMPFYVQFFPNKSQYKFYNIDDNKEFLLVALNAYNNLVFQFYSPEGEINKLIEVDYKDSKIRLYNGDGEEEIENINFGEGYRASNAIPETQCGSLFTKIRDKIFPKNNNLNKQEIEISQIQNEIKQLWSEINKMKTELPKEEKPKVNEHSAFLKDILEYSPSKLNKIDVPFVEKKVDLIKNEQLTPLQKALEDRRKDIEYSDDDSEDIDWGEGYKKKTISLSEFLKKFS